MPKFEYQTEEYLTFDEVRRIRDKFKAETQNFVDFNPSAEQFGESRFKKQLPNLDKFPGVQFTSMYVTGDLPVSEKSYNSLQALLTEYAGTPLGCEASLSIYVGFQEAHSQQTKTTCDTLVAAISHGHSFFGYFANVGSRISKDRKYAARFFADLAKTAGLPLRVEQQESGYFLKPTHDLELFTTFTGTKDENPKGFRCELAAEVTAAELCRRLDAALRSHASENRLKYSWAFNVEDKKGDEASRLYGFLVDAELPASRQEVTYSLRLSDLRGIDALKELCQGKGELWTQIGTFDFESEDDFGELYVVTSSDGHRLELRLVFPDHLQDMEQLAGFRFVEI